MIRLAFLTTDSREHYGDYGNSMPSFGTAPEALLHGMTNISELEVHVVSCLQKPVFSPEKIAPNIWYHGLHVPKIGWMRTGYQGCVRAVRKKLKQIQPGIVHGQGAERDCAISAALSGYPNVVTIHGNMIEIARTLNVWPGTFHWLAAHFENFAIRRTSGVLCNSIHTKNLVKLRTPKTWLVPNPLRIEFFNKIIPFTPKEKCVLVNVGVISPNKRQLELLAVAEKLHHDGIKFEILFAGYASPKEPYVVEFLRQITLAEKKGYARYLGLLSIDKLIACFDEASALVHVPIAEAFGLVVAEALSRNLKFFGSRAGGVPDIAAEADSAELFDEKDWSGLGASISKWIQQGSPRPKQAAELMFQRYHPNKIAQRHLEIYREVLSKPS